MSKEIKYPYIVFKLVDTYYCVSSECISTIVQLPQYDKIPESPETVTGMFRYRNQVIQMLDLRTTFDSSLWQKNAGILRR
ncbi:chemotaxis protein CheW [Enterocloster sp.]|uniref:chemotaxis protein CheW n=1 Tax=Enterocloster sp. TaxID=2719315 RepID=UPI0039A24C1D